MKDSNIEGILILIALVVIVFFLPKDNFKNNSGNESQSTNNVLISSATGEARKPSINLNRGNASQAYQTYEEYISISNQDSEPINITGWKLKNNKDKRAYDLGNDTVKYFPADTLTIPQATQILSPLGQNIFQDVILKNGEKAIITTGKIGISNPFTIVSFKENICTGYLESMDEYKFTPSLTKNCPRPITEPGTETLSTECRNFIERLSSCSIPKFETKDQDGNTCDYCINGKPLSSSCVTFVKNHYNYPGCVTYHRSDPKFQGKTWRIFLGQGWEMWATNNEVIKIFDRGSNLIKEYSY